MINLKFKNIDHFKNHIFQNLPFLKESRLLIAVSGGLDSVVLTHLCHRLHLNITLAHCNFKLRGEESDADKDFVSQLAEHLNLEVFIESFDTRNHAERYNMSIQMAARELRYNWFETLATQLKFDYILTAHHADDNLETFLINLSRGTGLEGLTGIPQVNDKVVRPLLPYSRDTLEQYAREHNMDWREDSSNASTKYLRNKLRHDVIPVLKEINPQLLQNFKKTLGHLNDSQGIIKESVQDVLKYAQKVEKHQVIYDISEFEKLENPKAYLYEIFKEYGFTAWKDVANLLNAQSGKQLYSSTHRLIKDRKHLLLVEIHAEEDRGQSIISKNDLEVKTDSGTLSFAKTDQIQETNTSIIYVDADLLEYPLTIRTREEGDVFYPLGMVGKKKLSKYFKDEKLSLFQKEHVQLLCSNNQIVWVIGRRADNRFKVTEKTKQILKIEWR